MTVSPHQVFYLIIEVIRNNKVIVSFSISYTNLKGEKNRKRTETEYGMLLRWVHYLE
jgi:hypothetical protein